MILNSARGTCKGQLWTENLFLVSLVWKTVPTFLEDKDICSTHLTTIHGGSLESCACGASETLYVDVCGGRNRWTHTLHVSHLLMHTLHVLIERHF